jgi:hypothetical protein
MLTVVFGQRTAHLGVLPDHAAEAEAVVGLAHQTPHPIDTLVERRTPLAELRRRGVALLQPLDDGIGGQLPRLERQQDA